jgi:hypothetical protein
MSMKRLIAILSLLFCAGISSPVAGQTNVISGTIEPRTRYKSPVVPLEAGDKIKVTAKGPQDLSLDVYVYAEATQELAAKSDDDAVEPFAWTVPLGGRYYVVLRNSSDVAGTYQIRLSTPEIETKAIPNKAIPNAAVIKIFYATDRAAIQQHTAKGTIYGGEPIEQLQFGICQVSIPRAHRMGELERFSAAHSPT